MDAATVVSIILAIVSLLGTVAVAIAGHISNKTLQKEAGKAAIEQDRKSQRLTHNYEMLKQEQQDRKDTEALLYKNGQPLSVAAYELQARLYELCQYPISKAHLESNEGLQDLKQYTCYKLTQYFTWSHIPRMKA